MVEEVSSPVVEWSVPGRFIEWVDRHLKKAGDTHVVALLRFPLVQVHLLPAHAVGHPVPEGVGHRVGDRVTVDVDRVNMPGAVSGELHSEDAATATNVEAGLVLPDVVSATVAQDEDAAPRRDEPDG